MHWSKKKARRHVAADMVCRALQNFGHFLRRRLSTGAYDVVTASVADADHRLIYFKILDMMGDSSRLQCTPHHEARLFPWEIVVQQ